METEIKSWDGKSKADILAIYKEYCGDKGFVRKLIQLVQKSECQQGATWLLKAYIDSGGVLSQSDSSILLSSLKDIKHWQAKLHFLQFLYAVKIPGNYKTAVEYFVRSLITDDNKFVRAWAYNGFYLLAKAYPEYRDEASQFFEMAMRDEAPSVKARIRAIVKSGF